MDYWSIFMNLSRKKIMISFRSLVGVGTTIIFLMALTVGGWGNVTTTSAVGNLEAMKDIIGSAIPGAGNVSHEISFRLPFNSLHIATSDYIIIDMGNFSNVTEANQVTGIYGGTPVFSLDGSEVKITGILVESGIQLTISGITATNPGSPMLYGVTVIVSEDEDGMLIKNVGTVLASGTDGSVSVTASIDPPVASLAVSGYTSPGTFVTFTNNGTVIGTDTAGPSGFFSQIFTGLQPMTHMLRIYGIDQQGRATAPFFLEIYTPIYQLTTVTDIILPPTIQLSDTVVLQGNHLVVSGSAVPSGDLSLFTESPMRSYSTTVNPLGNWAYTITDTADYLPGDYRAYSIVQDGSLQSLAGIALGFSVTALATTPTPANCNISQGDLNCDTNVNLFDFSILMYYWGTTQPAGDINGDGVVNLFDFSIMMYYWGT